MPRSEFSQRFPQRKTIATTLLAANVRRLRLGRGMTQDDLAAELGVEQQTISLIENGRANPTVLLLDEIAKALKVQIAELFQTDAKTVHKPSSKIQR